MKCLTNAILQTNKGTDEKKTGLVFIIHSYILGSEDGKIHVWNAESGMKVALLDGKHTGPITCLQFNPKFMTFASACSNMVRRGSGGGSCLKCLKLYTLVTTAGCVWVTLKVKNFKRFLVFQAFWLPTIDDWWQKRMHGFCWRPESEVTSRGQRNQLYVNMTGTCGKSNSNCK